MPYSWMTLWECWGRDDHGQASPPAGAFATVSAGWLYTCGLEKTAGDQQSRPGGSIKCWGQLDEHRVPSGPFGAVSAGQHHACGLRYTGTVECWGIKDGFDNSLDDRGQADPPTNLKFSTVSAGGFHTCGNSGGIVWCWGRNDDDQANAPREGFIAVSSGQFHSCGIRPEEEATYEDHDGTRYQVLSSGTIHCWGQNTLNQTDAPRPGDPDAVTTIATASTTQSDAIDAGSFHTCVIQADGTVECWGWNRNGEADPPGGQFIAVSAGVEHSCGIRADGTVDCWGGNWNGEADPPGRSVHCGVGRASAFVWDPC